MRQRKLFAWPLLLGMLAFGSQPTLACRILGFGPGGIYNLNGGSGQWIRENPIFTVGATGISGVFYITTGVNLWTMDLFGNNIPMGGFDRGGVDLALDSTLGLYGIDPSGLYRVRAPQESEFVAPIPAGIEGISFGPDQKIYAVSNFDSFLWQIDPLSGDSVPIGPTGLPFGVVDLQYDWGTGTFLASVLPGFSKFQLWPIDTRKEPSFGWIVRIDLQTGQSVVLNDHAPVIYGMAYETPEPSTLGLLLLGISALLYRRQKMVRQKLVDCRRLLDVAPKP